MTTDARSDRNLTFRSGGWVILVAILLCVALVGWAISGVLLGHRPIGGGDLASYRFDLSSALVPIEELTPTGQTRDFVPPLVATGAMPGSEMVAFNARRKRYVVSGDRVVGATIGGEHRAYPLSVLQVHEAIEDTLGGVPILVAYSPISDAAAIYDRRVGDETLSFGLSGLVRNANTLYFDRRGEGEGEIASSLWQQIDGRAITGPAAAEGRRLAPVGSLSITRWSDWLAEHPETTVVLRDESRVRHYRNVSYERDHARAQIGFPVSAMPPKDSFEPKRRILIVESASGRRFVPLDLVASRGERGWTLVLPEGSLTIRADASSGTYRAEGDALPAVRVRPAFWFAAYANLDVRDDEIVRDLDR